MPYTHISYTNPEPNFLVYLKGASINMFMSSQYDYLKVNMVKFY